MVLQSVFGCVDVLFERFKAGFTLLFLAATGMAISLGAPATGYGQAVTHYGSQKLVVNDVSNAYDAFEGIAVDNSGNLYIADCAEAGVTNYLSVCKETLQSDGTYVESVLFDNARNGLNNPNYVAVDSSGNVYISDELNGRVLKETLSGTTYIQSIVTNYAAGGLTVPEGIAVDSAGNVYITDPDNARVLKETLSGSTYTQSVIGSGFRNPVAVAVDTAGNVYIADDFTAEVYKETLSGGTYTQTVLLNSDFLNFFDTAGLAVDNQGDVYVVNASGGGGGSDANTVLKATPAGSGYVLEFVSSALEAPWAAAVDSKGNLYVTGFFNLVTEISFPPTSFAPIAVGTTSPVMSFPFTVGTDLTSATSGAALSLGAPSEFTDVGTGTCDTNGTSHVYKAGETCTVDVTFTPKFAGFRSGAVVFVNTSKVVAATAYISGTGVGPQAAFSPGTQSVVASGFTSPAGVAVDGNGTVYITDSGNGSNLFLETPSGSTYTQTTLGISDSAAPGPPAPQGVAVDGAGNVYFADSHDNYVTTEFFYEGQNNFLANLCDPTQGCGLSGPTGVAADLNGNIYIADTGNNRVVEEVYSSGNTYNSPTNYELQEVVAAELSAPQGVAADGSGNVYIADTGNNRILKEAPAGGGNFTQTILFDSGLNAPSGIAIDDFGDIYISDTGNKRVVKEAVSGSSYTQTVVPVTGLGAPKGLALDAAGDLFIADATNGDVLKLAFGSAPSLTFASTAEGATSSDSPQSVTLENIGTAPLAFAVPGMGSNPSISTSFTLNSAGGTACPLLTATSSAATLAANASCTLAISFTPAASDSISGSLVLTDNNLNSAGATQTIALNGTGTESSEPVASLSPTTISFPNTAAGSTSAVMSTTLSNTGNAVLNISGLSLGGTNPNEFAVVVSSSTCGSTLAAGATCTIAADFMPSAAGSYTASVSVQDDAAGGSQSVILTGTGTSTAAAVTETGNLWFNPAPVAIAAASAQTLTATFTLTGFASAITPTATMHYGLAYKVGAVTCTGTAGDQTCTVPVTFIPNYPGGRRDALFLMNGTTRLASQLAYGIGESPFALIQPGIVTNPVLNSTNYQYTSVTGEDGTLYQLEDEGNAVEAVTSAGVVTTLPITGLNSPRGIGIDGAGVLYIVDQTFNGHFTTYDTVQGVQGSLPFPDSSYFQTLAVGNEGTVYAFGSSDNGVWTIPQTGTPTLTVLNPTFNQPSTMTVDSAENVFIGGYAINEITAGGTQTQINTTGAGDGLSTDAAGTVYATRYGGVGGVALLPATNYGQYVATVDSSAPPLGVSVGPDGTVYVGNYSNVDKVDRSQGTISFGEQSANTAATPQAVQIYNGGNETLTLSNITVSGDAFTIQTSSTANCTQGGTVAMGALCNLSVGFLPTHAGTYSGTVTITSNSLNNTTTTQTVALSGFVYGVYVQATPNPLAFGSQAIGTTSPSLTVTFTNNGDLYAAGIGSLTSSDPAFAIAAGSACSSVGVGSSCTATVTFTPTVAKAYSSTISFSASSAGGGPNQNGSFTASGTGVGTVSVSPTSIDFGDQVEYTYNYSNVQKVTVTNNSNATLTLGTLGFSKGFQLYQDDCGSQLLGQSSCYYLIDFFPQAVGSFTGTLSIPYTGTTGSPLVVNLSGTGTAGTPAIALYPSPVDFGTLPVMTPAQAITVQLDASGTAPLTGISISITGANANDFSETNACSGEIDPYPGNQVCNIVVNFTPSGGGPRVATLNVSSNGGAATTSEPLEGAGVAALPQIQFSPTQLNLFAGADGVCGNTTGGGAAIKATLCNVNSAAQDYLGNTYLVDTHYNVVYKVDTSGNIAVFAGAPGTTGGYGGDGGPATSATLSGPTAVAADAFGDIFISDTANQAIRIVDPTGTINTFVDSQCDSGGTGRPKPFGAVAPGKGHRHSLDLCATLQPEGLVVDSSGNLIWADPLNNAVFETNITTGGFNIVAGKASDGAGIAGYNGDNMQANGAELNAPQDVAVDPAGNVYIADTLNYRIRKVTTATGIITTVAGNGTKGDTGDGAAATSATINVYGVSADLGGDLFIATGSGGVVRKVDASGNIDLFAGGGTGAVSGPASSGAIANAYFARVDNSGDLLIPAGPQVLEAGPNGLLQFGTESVGSTSAALTATVENTGDSNLSITSTGTTITGADAGDFAVSSNNCGTSEAPGKTCALSVTFTPSATGARTATLSVGTNAAGSPQTVLLQGNGSAAPAPIASLSPTTLSFPSTTAGTISAALTTTLSNTGNAALSITGITLAGTNPGDFTETNNCGTSLAAGATCTISATFTPAAVASYTATISVADNAAGSPQTATLSGTGTAAPAPIASLSPTTLSFPSTTAGTISAALTTTLSNTGNAALSITGITLAGTNPGDFAETNNCGSSLAAGANCTISVTFSPAAAASYTASVSVADNASGSPQTATLSGTGTAVPAPVATLSPGALTFANTPAGATTAAQTLTLSNTGNALLNISGITIGGTNAADFAETTTCGTTLAPGASCTIGVTFTPASVASYTATVSVADNAAGSPQTATLAGTGTTPPDFTVNSSTPMETVQAGGAAQYPIVVTATGGDFTGSVVLTATGLPPGATASFAPASVTPDSGSAASVLTIQTGSGQAAARARWPWAPITALAFCVPLLWWRRRSRGRLLSAGLLCALLSVMAMLTTGCGGGYYLNTSKTYTVTVTGTSGPSQHSTTVTLIIE